MSIARRQFSIEVGGKPLVLEITDLAGRTNAAVFAKYGETVVLVTAVMGQKESSVDYLPLKVDYEERFYAAGKEDRLRTRSLRVGLWIGASARFLTRDSGGISKSW